MRKLLGLACVVALMVWACGSDSGGGLKKALSGKSLSSGAKALKPGSDGKVQGKEGQKSTTQVSTPSVGGKAGSTNLQQGDDGDEVYQDVAYDMDGDGNPETVDVIVDDETGHTYYSWTDKVDANGDGTEETVNYVVVDNGDGTYDVYVEVPGEGTVVCDGVSETAAGNCEVCDASGKCENISGDDLYGGFEEETATDGSGGGNESCLQECAASCAEGCGEEDAQCLQNCGADCAQKCSGT